MTNSGKELREAEIINQKDKRALILNFENFYNEKILKNVDAIIIDEKKIKKILSLKNLPPLIVRLNKKITPNVALILGANACVYTFFFGFSEDDEAQSVKKFTKFARECTKLNLPLIVEVRPEGPKVNKNNFSAVVKLSITMLTELGADMIFIPYPGKKVLEEVKEFLSVPVFIILKKGDVSNLKKSLQFGLDGAVINKECISKINKIRNIIRD